MEFYQLEYLCAVANCGGYNQAARHLFRVPSAVKRGVALLEDEVGIRLASSSLLRMAEEERWEWNWSFSSSSFATSRYG